MIYEFEGKIIKSDYSNCGPPQYTWWVDGAFDDLHEAVFEKIGEGKEVRITIEEITSSLISSEIPHA